jgi:hypothetical protein
VGRTIPHNAGVAGPSPAPAIYKATTWALALKWFLISGTSGFDRCGRAPRSWGHSRQAEGGPIPARDGVVQDQSRTYTQGEVGGSCFRSASSRTGSSSTCLTACVPPPTVAAHLDKGTPGESRGRRATGPRLLRDAAASRSRRHEGPKIAELPKVARRSCFRPWQAMMAPLDVGLIPGRYSSTS